MARIDAAAIRVDRDWVTAEEVVDAAMRLRQTDARRTSAARGRQPATSRSRSIRVSHRARCRTFSRTRRSTRRPAARSRWTRAWTTTACTFQSPTRDPVWMPVSSNISSSVSIEDSLRDRRPSAPAWASRSRVDCSRLQADESGQKTCPGGGAKFSLVIFGAVRPAPVPQ